MGQHKIKKQPRGGIHGADSYCGERGLILFLHLFLVLLDQSLLDIVRHELVA